MSNGKILFEKGAPNGKSVGIVGSGPAGISCAAYLARLGYAVTIYERKAKPGGLDAYGMAEYKMTQATAVAEAERLKSLGVEFVLGTDVGVMPPPPALAGLAVPQLVAVGMSDGDLMTKHDAVFLGIGLGATKTLEIPGEDLSGVIDALQFIERIKTRDWPSIPTGRHVAVIGAGNTAIDAVTQAKRLGVERVFMIYRKTAREMSAYQYEYELAKQDGIEFVWQTEPIEIKGDERVKALRCRKTDGSDFEFDLPCDLIIKAIGQTKQTSFFGSLGLELDDRGRVVVNGHMRTSNPKIFAGGDCVNGGAEAVDAAQAGKRAAAGIHEVLLGEDATLAGL